MKTQIALLLLLSSTAFASAGTATSSDMLVPAQTDLPSPNEPATMANIKIEEPTLHATSAYDQLITVQVGSYRPQSAQVGNGSYTFDYGSGINAFMSEVGWAIKLVEMTAGSLYFEENLAFSTFSGSAVQNGSLQLSSSSYSLYLFGLDSRVMYAADWFPWKSLVPFGDAGYEYTSYYQPASSGLESTSGGVGNFVTGGGLRLWLNRTASINGGMPIFLTAKANRIFPSGGALNLASTSFLGGLTLGL